jgi:hypothetical protein
MRGRLYPLGDLGSGDAAMREHERRQLLCRRSGCFCTEEDAMSEPTPEAIKFAKQEMADWDFPDPEYAGTTILFVARMLEAFAGAAVEAEREACAVVADDFIFNEECADLIRARGESEPTQPKENET